MVRLIGLAAVAAVMLTGCKPVADAVAKTKTEKLHALKIEYTKTGVRGILRNPDSAAFTDMRVITRRNSTEPIAVCGYVSSTNGFGARVRQRFVGSYAVAPSRDKTREGKPANGVTYLLLDNEKGTVGLGQWNEHCTY